MEQEPRAVAETDDAQRYAHMGPGLWLLRVLHGALIGAGAILPGISGGVLCVAFGVYEPVMAFLSHPVKTFRAQWRMFVPILLGGAAGRAGAAGCPGAPGKAGRTPAPRDALPRDDVLREAELRAGARGAALYSRSR